MSNSLPFTDPADYPSACAVIAAPDHRTDDQYVAYFVFELDPIQYMQDLLAEGNYDPFHDPYADHRSIASAGEMISGTGTLATISDYAGFLGMPLIIMPDTSPENYAGQFFVNRDKTV